MRLVHYIDDDNGGRRVAFVEEATRSKLRLCMMDAPIDTKLVPKRNERYMHDLDYPMKKAAKKFRHAGRTLGITKNARKMLRRV